MTTAVIVQARLGSSRLPGKVLMELGGRSVLRHVLERCDRIEGADMVVCAVPEGAADDPVAVEAERCGASVFRGSERDVLSRYHGAATACGASVAMRVTSDCPFVDPAVCADVLTLRAERGADYAANNMPPSWPHGLDCEAFTMDALDAAHRAATEPYDREHVTPWIRRNESYERVNLPCPVEQLGWHRWTLDHPEDLAFMRCVLEAHAAEKSRPADGEIPDWRALVALMARRPELAGVNEMRRDR